MYIYSNFLYIGQHPRNDTFCTGSTSLLSCTVYDNTTSNAADNTVWFKVDDPPVGISLTMINNTRNGDVVTSVLTIDNVSLNDNGTEYFCSPSFGIRSYVGAILVAGTCTYVRINICNFLYIINNPFHIYTFICHNQL